MPCLPCCLSVRVCVCLCLCAWRVRDVLMCLLRPPSPRFSCLFGVDVPLVDTHSTRLSCLARSLRLVPASSPPRVPPSSGSKRTLTHADLGDVPDQDSAARQHGLFAKNWQRELDDAADAAKPPSVLRALRRTIGVRQWLTALVLQFGRIAFSFLPPLILRELVSHFEERIDLSDTTLWLYVAAMLLAPLASSVCMNAQLVIMSRLGVRMKTVLSVAVFRHALEMRSSANISTGAVVTRMSVDAQQLQNITQVRLRTLCVAF